jgi:hypothetical protein
MKQYLYPAFSLIILKMIIMTRMFLLRKKNVKEGKVSPHYFKLYSGENQLDKQTVYTERNFNNLFQLPGVFYGTMAILLALKIENQLALIMCWVFAVSRYAHSYVHVTRNRISPRLTLYATGWGCILILWLVILIKA